MTGKQATLALHDTQSTARETTMNSTLTDSPQQTSTLRVLLVDDEPKVLDGLRRMLRHFRGEWDMHFASGGRQALELLSEKKFDVVVSDMRMPGIDGAELLRRVQNHYPDTVRIVLSGHSDQESVLRAVGPAHQYLSKPCEAEVLRDAIRTTCEARSAIASPVIRDVVGKIDVLPTLPEVYCQLVEELKSPAASIERAGQIIASDLGISAKILQVVNSSFFGLPVHVTDVSHAASLLGLDIIQPLVLSAGVFRQFDPRKLGRFQLSALVDHSLESAITARQIARREGLDKVGSDHAFLAGLLHDLGQVLLAQSYPAQYQLAVEHARDHGEPLDEMEEAEFGAHHGLTGAYLLSLWGLPNAVIQAVAWHCRPSDAPGEAEVSPLTAVHAAEVLLDQSHEASREQQAFDDRYLEKLGLGQRPEVWSRELLDG